MRDEKKRCEIHLFYFSFFTKMTELMFIYKNNATDLLYYTVRIFVVAFKIPYLLLFFFLLFVYSML